MFLKNVFVVSTATLAIALFATSSENYRVLMQFLVSASATLMVFHAMRGRAEYSWAGAFLAVAVVFNPLVPFALPRRIFIPLDLVCMALFFVYYNSYKSKPSLVMPSVIDRTPGQH